MADTPEQARVRAQLAARGNQLAPRVNPSTGDKEPAKKPSVVKAAVKGAKSGPAGAARSAVKAKARPKTLAELGPRTRSRAKPGRRNQGKASSTYHPRHGTGTRQVSYALNRGTSRPRQYAAKRGKAFTLKTFSGPHTSALFAEYFGGALIISLDLFTEGASKGYLPTMSKVMIRLTALTAIFFVLFLMTGSKKGGQAAVWLGLLIDLGIVFTAARGQTFSTVASEASGQGIPGTQLDASYSQGNYTQPAQMQLPNE